jgi:hypothetical protein
MSKNWIKTSEQLPNEGENVIFFFKWTGVHRGVFTYFKIGPLPPIPCFSIDNQWYTGISHWIKDRKGKLPNPPPTEEINWND